VVNERTVVVSGGGSGIGRAVAERLVRDGLHVAIVGRRSVVAIAADLATEAGASAVADQLGDAGMVCAGVVAAAGGLSPRPCGG